MKLKQIESLLSQIPYPQFVTPNIVLEQYVTSISLTAQIIYTIYHQYHDIGPYKTVIDLGCGTGMLSIGCAIVETDMIIGIDCDRNAIQRAISNVSYMDYIDCISFIEAKVPSSSSSRSTISSSSDRRKNSSSSIYNKSGSRRGHGRNNNDNNSNRFQRKQHHHRHRPRKQAQQEQQQGIAKFDDDDDDDTREIQDQQQWKDDDDDDNNNDHSKNEKHRNNNNNKDDDDDDDDVQYTFPLRDKCVDTVITNPPFGTKGNNDGIDIQFVLLACRLAKYVVYSFHKSSTRSYVIRTIQQNVPNCISVKVIGEMKFDIPQTYTFHQHTSVDIAVDLIRVELQKM